MSLSRAWRSSRSIFCQCGTLKRVTSKPGFSTLSGRWATQGFSRNENFVRGKDVLIPGPAVFDPAIDGDPHAVDLEPGQPVDAAANRLIVPAQQPVGGRAVPEVMLARAFPDEMPRVFLVHTNQATPLAVLGFELTGMRGLVGPLAIRHRIRVLSGFVGMKRMRKRLPSALSQKPSTCTGSAPLPAELPFHASRP